MKRRWQRRLRKPAPPSPEQRLIEVSTRELWQLELWSADGLSAGRVIRLIIEPRLYTVRYLVVYAPAQDRHVPVPATCVQDIGEEGVRCDLALAEIQRLPSLPAEWTRGFEEALHTAAGRTPYWVEEAMFQPPPQSDGP